MNFGLLVIHLKPKRQPPATEQVAATASDTTAQIWDDHREETARIWDDHRTETARIYNANGYDAAGRDRYGRHYSQQIS